MKTNILKYSIASVLMLISINTLIAQTATNHHGVVSPAVILDMSTIDESIVQGDKAKGFVLPVVEIEDVLNKEEPIKNPAEGMLVYNNSKVIIPGVYMFKNGMWSAIVNRGSSIENAVIKVQNSTWQRPEEEPRYEIEIPLKEFDFDNTYGDVLLYDRADGLKDLMLRPGNYLIAFYLRGKIEDEGNMLNIENTLGDTNQSYRAHLINFRSEVRVDTAVVLNNAFADALVPFAVKENGSFRPLSREFSASFYFGLTIPEKEGGNQISNVKLILQAVEGTTFKKGNIIILDTYVNIEKSIL
ncbi:MULTISPECIES: hypothetical protein [Myroides]|uniref:hypothetical protein n=1 Tax=Myroides TaxID=76831 RepID=UPI0013036F2A|nr:hypothetical protein [Myroides phaeus]